MTANTKWTPSDWLKVGGLLVGLALSLVGAFMMYHGIAAEGAIDLKSSVVSGTIKTGSAGLFICFFGFLIVVFVLASLLTASRNDGAVVPATHGKARRLLPMFWGVLIAFMLATLGAAYSPTSEMRLGFGIAVGTLSFVLVALITAMIRMTAQEEA